MPKPAERLSRRRARWGIAIVVAVLAAVGIGTAARLLHEEDAAVPESAEASVVDASTDARAPGAKRKPGKKPAARGGKTRVAGHTGGGGAHGPAAPRGGSKRPTTAAGHHDAPAGQSYESALGSNDEQVTIGANGHADLTDAQLAAPMSDGAFVSECGVPESTSVTVKVAIQMGHAVGVSVETSPPSPHAVGCIDRYVRALAWPTSSKMDSLVTTY